VARVVARIHQALHPETAAVLVRNALNGRFEPLAGAESSPLQLSDDSKVVSIARVLQKPLETPATSTGGLASALPASERDALRDARVELIVPVVTAAGQMEMLLALGPRRSEEPYSPEDIDLLAAVADGLAMALDRAAPRGVTAGEIGTGRCLAGRYRIEGQLGEGGMGTVYAATDLALEREVAVKLVREDLVASPAARARFQQETRIAASFTHPNIVTVHDYGVVPGGRAFIVMERLRGETLADRLARESALAPDVAVPILREVSDAIEVAHGRGLVHRDLKPSNIFLARDDAGERAKVLDFGIAKLLSGDGSAATTSAGAVVGTPRYMAPEQLRGEEASTSWDVWALTMIAFEMLTGGRAFDGAVISQPGALGGAPAEWRPFFDDALAFEAARRPATVRTLVDGLVRMLSATPAATRV
jgi:serine/threonine-protein kinase